MRSSSIIHLRPLLAIAVSAAYTGGSFVASFGTVAIIVRDIDSTQRAGFFLFLAIFSPFITVLSQRNLLSIYEGAEGSIRSRISMEVLVFALTVLTLLAFANRFFTLAESVILATTVLSQLHAVGAQARVQHESGNRARWAWATILIAVLRITVSWAVLPLGPVLAFAAGCYAYLFASLALPWFALRRRHAAERQKPAVPAVGEWRKQIALTLFFAVGAVVYQVDKFALQQDVRADDIANSGALTMLALSPLSLIFATVYRSQTNSIFDSSKPGRQKIQLILRIILTYFSISIAYSSFLFLAWGAVRQHIFPFLGIGYAHFAIFALAIFIDKSSSLFQFTGRGRLIYDASTAFKILLTIALYFLIRIAMPSISLLTIFSLYASISIVHFILIAILFWRRRDSDNGSI